MTNQISPSMTYDPNKTYEEFFKDFTGPLKEKIPSLSERTTEAVLLKAILTPKTFKVSNPSGTLRRGKYRCIQLLSDRPSCFPEFLYIPCALIHKKVACFPYEGIWAEFTFIKKEKKEPNLTNFIPFYHPERDAPSRLPTARVLNF